MFQEAGAFLHRRVLCSQIKSASLGSAHAVQQSESLTCRFSGPQWLAGVSAISEIFYSSMDTTDASVEGWAPENLATSSACARPVDLLATAPTYSSDDRIFVQEIYTSEYIPQSRGSHC